MGGCASSQQKQQKNGLTYQKHDENDNEVTEREAQKRATFRKKRKCSTNLQVMIPKKLKKNESLQQHSLTYVIGDIDNVTEMRIQIKKTKKTDETSDSITYIQNTEIEDTVNEEQNMEKCRSNIQGGIELDLDQILVEVLKLAVLEKVHKEVRQDRTEQGQKKKTTGNELQKKKTTG